MQCRLFPCSSCVENQSPKSCGGWGGSGGRWTGEVGVGAVFRGWGGPTREWSWTGMCAVSLCSWFGLHALCRTGQKRQLLQTCLGRNNDRGAGGGWVLGVGCWGVGMRVIYRRSSWCDTTHTDRASRCKWWIMPQRTPSLMCCYRRSVHLMIHFARSFPRYAMQETFHVVDGSRMAQTRMAQTRKRCWWS